MKLKFEQTQDDVLDLSKHSIKNNRMLKITGVIVLLIFILNSIDFGGENAFSLNKLLSSLIPLLLIGGLWYLIVKWLMKKRFQNPANKKMLVGEREIELTDAGIRVWTPVSETNYQWSAISKIEQSDKNYFLYLGRMQAILISKNAFNNQAQMTEFENLVNSKIS